MDDIDDFPLSQLHVGLDLKFNAIRIVDNRMIPVQFELGTELLAFEPLEDEDEDMARATEVYEKIKYFVEKVLEGSMIVACDNVWAFDTLLDDETGLPSTDNAIVLLPGNPTNATLSQVLQSKFKALSNGNFEFSFVQIKSSDMRGLAFTFVGDASEELPEMEDWIGVHSYFSKPWWDRDDASTLDVTPTEDADLANPPGFAYSLAFLSESFRKAEPAKIVRAEFRPRVIEGGKVD